MKTINESSSIRELDLNEIDTVSGGVSQDTAINTNLGIIGIGVGVAVAGVTAPAWFPIAMMGVSIAATGSYIYQQLQ